MKKLKIGTKISLGFTVVIALMGLCTLVVIVTNIITTQNLNSINSDSTFQMIGGDLSDAFYEARLNAKIIVMQPDDNAYAEVIKYLNLCGDITRQMKGYINDNPVLKKFNNGLIDVESNIEAYVKEIDNLQKSNTFLNTIEGNIVALGETLTELSDALDGKHISILSESVSSDVSLAEMTHHLDNLTNGAMISNSIWNIRDHTGSMIQLGINYDNYNTDLKYIDNVINLVQTSKSTANEIAEIGTQLSKYQEDVIQFRDEMVKNNVIVTNVVSCGVSAMDSLNSLITDVNDALAKQVTNSMNTATILLVIVLTAAVASVIIAIIMAEYIKRSIISVLGKSIHDMENVSNTVVTSSQQLNDGSAQLAEGASEQAASIEETSATMNETASMVKQTKENTGHAVRLSGQSERHASESVQKVMNLMEIMSNLKESSKEISNIVETINTISFQTNILALNAAVESVRAGEAGRSFAAVAEEVRSLSQKSTAAAASTSEIIERNISLTEQGINSSREVSEALDEIFIDVQKVNELLSEISAASEEQSHGIDQINTAISQMEKVTQSSAAVAQQASASANEMLDSSQLLASVTSELSAMI